jgi:nucleoside-diphosphate-sugar epimerase
MKKHTLFITGGAGYVGAMLVDQFAARSDVERIITLDKEPETDLTKQNPNKDKIVYIEKNLSDSSWVAEVAEYAPTIVVHTAWQIREIYGDKALSWKWNIEASDILFDFCFKHSSVERLVYFSTVSSYGAFADNTLDQRFVETDAFRKTQYLYAEEKRIAEEHLEQRYARARSDGEYMPIVSIVRPAAITGPRGRYTRIRFGLQSALSGNLRGGVYSIVSALTKVVPATPKWVRQYIHEDDVTDIVALLSFDPGISHAYEAFNISPPGDAVLAPDMAEAVGKKMLVIDPVFVRIAFFFFWHLTRGKVPTAAGAWKGYSYPILVDGSKISTMYKFNYSSPSKQAFVKNEGRYKVELK